MHSRLGGKRDRQGQLLLKSACVGASVNVVEARGISVDRRLHPSPKVPLTVNGQEALALADTGADMNVMPLSYVRGLGLQLQDEAMEVETANGEKVAALGRVDLSLKLQGRAMIIPFLVFDSLRCRKL